jgi:hypothetical protein
MLLAKSLLIGLLVASVTLAVWTLGEFLVALVLVRGSVESTGSGGLGAVSFPTYGPFVAVVSFVVATAVSYVRARRRRGTRTASA